MTRRTFLICVLLPLHILLLLQEIVLTPVICEEGGRTRLELAVLGDTCTCAHSGNSIRNVSPLQRDSIRARQKHCIDTPLGRLPLTRITENDAGTEKLRSGSCPEMESFREIHGDAFHSIPFPVRTLLFPSRSFSHSTPLRC